MAVPDERSPKDHDNITSALMPGAFGASLHSLDTSTEMSMEPPRPRRAIEIHIGSVNLGQAGLVNNLRVGAESRSPDCIECPD